MQLIFLFSFFELMSRIEVVPCGNGKTKGYVEKAATSIDFIHRGGDKPPRTGFLSSPSYSRHSPINSLFIPFDLFFSLAVAGRDEVKN